MVGGGDYNPKERIDKTFYGRIQLNDGIDGDGSIVEEDYRPLKGEKL